MIKINYVIATWNGKNNRSNVHSSPNDLLRNNLIELLKCKNSYISQITIMKAQSNNYYENYYNLDDIISMSSIPIVQIECENFAFSPGQWLKAYEIYKNQFDHFIFMEDDYCPNMLNYDSILLEMFNNLFRDNIGILSGILSGNVDHHLTKTIPIHWGGSLFISNDTLNKMYENPTWQGNPRQYLDKYNEKDDPYYTWKQLKRSYSGGYYQVVFSQLFLKSNIKYEEIIRQFDYVNENKYNVIYWDDAENISWKQEINDQRIYDYTKHDLEWCIFIPVQII